LIKVLFTSNSVVELLTRLSVKHTVHEFPSGAIMLDIWYQDYFYVLQFEDRFVGFSEITDENPGFDTIPDEKFYHEPALLAKIQSVLAGIDQA
jgi:hypothetical protein